MFYFSGTSINKNDIFWIIWDDQHGITKHLLLLEFVFVNDMFIYSYGQSICTDYCLLHSTSAVVINIIHSFHCHWFWLKIHNIVAYKKAVQPWHFNTIMLSEFIIILKSWCSSVNLINRLQNQGYQRTYHQLPGKTKI